MERPIEPDNPSSKRRRTDNFLDEIQKYLKPDVEPVTLPNRDEVEQEILEDGTLASYPPLILDGASGIGKTQQAFALLKAPDRHRLIYLILAPTKQNSQKIYQQMEELTGMGNVTDQIDKVLPELRSISDESDRLSVESIEKYIKKAKADKGNDEGDDGGQYKQINHFLSWLREGVLEYNHSSGNIDKTTRSLDDLDGTVLFVDEALPSKKLEESITKNAEIQTDTQAKGVEKPECPKDRLKFLRNLGRVLGMRAVLAGTAATAANMWTIPTNQTKSQSRTADKNYTWAVVQFLYRHLPRPVPNNRSISHRPLVHRWLDKYEGKNLKVLELILKLRNEMTLAKTFTPEGKFIWLTGACLSTSENTLTPFELKPSALVQSHFFEPVVAACEYEKNGQSYTEIHDGKGFGKISRRIRRETRLKIIKYKIEDRKYWVLRQDNEDEELRPIFGSKYSFIEYALTNCVQICLVVEPLFAVCISLSQFLDPGEFKEAIREALPQETIVQRNRGGLDGELHEQIIFAALQLSTNDILSSQVTVKECVKQLHDYLRLQSVDDSKNYNRVARVLKTEKNINVVDKPSSQEMAYHYHKDADKALEEEATRMFQELVQMPWLIPACDKQSLEQKIQDFGTDYFADLNIAGLVPGVTNAAMDAEAFVWKSYQNDFEPDWSFEFKARARSYSPNAAMKDLKKKMTYMRVGGKSKAVVKEAHKAHHGMLIGISRESRCEYCTVEADGKKYLRVVVLIGVC